MRHNARFAPLIAGLVFSTFSVQPARATIPAGLSS